MSDFKAAKYIFETPEGAENKACQWKTEIMNAIGQVHLTRIDKDHIFDSQAWANQGPDSDSIVKSSLLMSLLT